MYSSGVMSFVVLVAKPLSGGGAICPVFGGRMVLVRGDGVRGSVRSGDTVALLRVLGLLKGTSGAIGFAMGFLGAEVVGMIGRLDIGSVVFSSERGPVLRRTIIDCSALPPCFDDSGLSFVLDDDGLDVCFVCLVFARLAGLLTAFSGVSSTTISLRFPWPTSSLANGSSLFGGINWVSVSGAVAGRSGLSFRVIEDVNAWV